MIEFQEQDQLNKTIIHDLYEYSDSIFHLVYFNNPRFTILESVTRNSERFKDICNRIINMPDCSREALKDEFISRIRLDGTPSSKWLDVRLSVILLVLDRVDSEFLRVTIEDALSEPCRKDIWLVYNSAISLLRKKASTQNSSFESRDVYLRFSSVNSSKEFESLIKRRLNAETPLVHDL